MCVIPSMAACCCCVSELPSSATAAWLGSFGAASGPFLQLNWGCLCFCLRCKPFSAYWCALPVAGQEG